MSARQPPSLRARQINRPATAEADRETPDSAVQRVVRDTFSMPVSDYQLIDQLRQACLQQGVAVNKSELVRAGLKVLAALSESELRLAVARVEKVKVGRRRES